MARSVQLPPEAGKGKSVGNTQLVARRFALAKDRREAWIRRLLRAARMVDSLTRQVRYYGSKMKEEKDA